MKRIESFTYFLIKNDTPQKYKMDIKKATTMKDLQLFCEGTINDFMNGIIDRDEYMRIMEEYTERVYELTIFGIKKDLDHLQKEKLSLFLIFDSEERIMDYTIDSNLHSAGVKLSNMFICKTTINKDIIDTGKRKFRIHDAMYLSKDVLFMMIDETQDLSLKNHLTNILFQRVIIDDCHYFLNKHRVDHENI